jgi:RNA polymerase sigma factor (sigma-70 family)
LNCDMIATDTMVSSGDSELVQQSLSGDREAFGQIVSRYQLLICSLAYSATGCLGQSEDLAQETFITAWKRLGHLRQQHSLRAWLCGIARNRINNALRREGREPLRKAEPLDAIQESVAPGPSPQDQAISNEEAAILWRSLERIPAIYREPLILFYREHQSVEKVAGHLELNEDAVRQRLARGRKLLQEQVLAFIEGALERSNPGKAFTVAVLASLPGLAFSANAAAVGATAVTGGASAKTTGAMGLVSAMLGPLIVLIPNYIAYRVVLAGAHSDEERAGIKALYAKLGAITLAVFIPVTAVILWLARNQADRSFLSGLLATCLILIFLPTMAILVIASSRKSRRYFSQVLTQEYGGVFPKPDWEYRSQAQFLGLPLVHIRFGDRFAILKKPVKAWIAVGHVAMGGFFAFGAAAIAPISVGGFSLGLLSLGGLAVGGVALGGIAVGIWPLFGGLLIGWQAFNGCIAFGWSAAVGMFSFAHEYALGQFAHAAQANNEIARQIIFANPFFRCAEWIIRHWHWLNLIWIVPFFVMWRMARRRSSLENT